MRYTLSEGGRGVYGIWASTYDESHSPRQGYRHGDQAEGDGDWLAHPYIDEDAPLDISTRDLLKSLRLDDVEWALVELAVDACWEYEAYLRSTLKDGGTRGGGERYTGRTANGVLNEAGVPWRRQCALMHAVVRVGRDRGLSFSHEKGSTWRQSLDQEAA